MKIQKFLHSCLVVEENGRRALIDPGHYSFEELDLLSMIPKIDVILISHEHPDHCFIPGIKKIIKRDQPTIIANGDTAKVLAGASIEARIIKIPETIEIQGFVVTSVTAPHGLISSEPPLSNGFYINHRLFHPGDSFDFITSLEKVPEVLALPLVAGWGTVRQSIEVGLKVKPKYIIPIHDGFVKDDWREGRHAEHKKIYEKAGIQFHPLKPGETLEL